MILGVAVAMVLILEAMFWLHRYWKIWHLDAPLVKLDRDDVTFYGWCDKPITHEMLQKPFYIMGGFNWAGIIVFFRGPKEQLRKSGYPRTRTNPNQWFRKVHGGSVRVYLPIKGGVERFKQEYYKLHPYDGPRWYWY